MERTEDFYANAFERIDRSIIAPFIHRGSCVVDIGAHIGFFACLCADKVGPEGRVIAFEPTPQTFDQLQLNIGLNNFQNRFEVHRVALSDVKGKASFNLFSSDAGVYNSLNVTEAYGHRSQEKITVETDLLDNLVQGICAESISFIKIDVEGNEHRVIQGGERTLKAASNALLMIELHEAAARQGGCSVVDTVTKLEELGLKAFRSSPHGKLQLLGPQGLQSLLVDASVSQNVFFLSERLQNRLEAVAKPAEHCTWLTSLMK